MQTSFFGDKRRSYLEVLRWVADELLTAQAAGEDASPWERLQAKLRAQVDFADRYTVGYRALVSGGNGADEELAELAEEARWRSIRLIADALDVDDPEDLVQLMARELVSTLKRLDVDLAPGKRK